MPMRTQTDITKDIIKGNKQIMEEPFISLSEQAYKARRNMLIFSMCCLARWHGLSLKNGFNFDGNEIQNLDFTLLDRILLITTVYFTLYFFVLGLNVAKKWLLRTTGMENSLQGRKVAYWGGEGLSPEVNQSTAWPTIETEIKELQNALNNLETGQKVDLAALQKRLDQNRTQFIAFEKKFWTYFIDTWFAFWVFEYGGPLAFSCIAIILHMYKLC